MINKRLIAGLLTFIPGFRNKFIRKKTGGTTSARYCYSVLLRHLVMLSENGMTKLPITIAELGPGDSIGLGLAALLSGVQKYVGLDIIKYSSLLNNIVIFDELVELFKSRAAIPDEDEFPRISPRLSTYRFPHQILTDEILLKTLDSNNISNIKKDLMNFPDSHLIKYYAPWSDDNIVIKNSIDLIISQAVLEHIENLEETYSKMNVWLTKNGIMSHQIDFSHHGTASSWNGHWKYPNFIWNIIMRTRPYIINRKPYSYHENLLMESGFKIQYVQPKFVKSAIKYKQKNKYPNNIQEKDFEIRGSYMISKKSVTIIPDD